MKKLLLLLAAGMFLAASVGCFYGGPAVDTSGKLYVAKNVAFSATAYTCEPSGGNLNCKAVGMEGAGGAAPAEGGEEGGEAAEAEEAAEEAGGEAEEAVEEETSEEATE